MRTLWLLVAAAQSVAAPDVTARLNSTRLVAGEEVTLTVEARTRSAEPVAMTLPALTGFMIVGSRDVTEVTLEGVGSPVRTTTRQLQLRALRSGTLVIGPVRVRQGQREVTTRSLSVVVDPAVTGLATTLSPVVRGMLEAAPAPPRSDRVALTLIIPGDSVLVGQQLDVIAAAWFPRELRARLPRPPILSLQTAEGVWSYPGAVPTEISASRQVRGTWMDVFVAHQAAFPLAPGRIVLPPATLQYAEASSFGREESFSLRSDTVPVTVVPLPGGSSGADQVVGQGLTLSLDVEPANFTVGEPIAATATIAGAGNVALWPEPALRWPAGFRAYTGETGMHVEPRAGRIAGSKSFHYLVVPDSAGSFVMPEVRYRYYDLATGSYATAGLPPRAVAVAPGIEPRAARALPPLAARSAPAWPEEVARDLVPWGWLAVFVGPPLMAWLWRRRRVAEPASEPAPGPPLTRLGRLEREFHLMLASHVPDPHSRDGDGLARALRATGVERAVADHVMRLRDRLRASRYGPRGSGDAADLVKELERVLRVLGAEPDGRRRVVAVVVLACIGTGGVGTPSRPAQARAPAAEALYQAGALRAAADSFAARAAVEPQVAAHWYNLGATLYRAGADGKAAAAWTKAARLAPRDPLVRRTRDWLPTPDAPSELLLTTGLVAPAEWAVATGVLWVALWLAVAARRRRLLVAAVAALTAAAGGLGVREGLREARPLAVVLNPATPVRVAPYGTASPASTVEAGAALLVEGHYGPWLEVRRDDGIHGWVLATQVARL
ncbi:MAG TPA: BatD family protein [Gemmatimonadales bacterium]|nr:BatD family protein [Gemmatimonadales bacterium]